MSNDLLSWPDMRVILPRGWDIRLSPRFITYRPNFRIYIETPRYILKTAENMGELLSVFKLRYQNFLENTASAKKHAGYDVDEFDSECDHIIIIDRDTNKVCGNYRVISSVLSPKFYSQTEYNLDDFLKSEESKLELGRACIHYGHRNGHVIDLLWRGIARYVHLTGARYLFGCSSLKTTCPRESKRISQYFLEQGLIEKQFNIYPLEHFNMGLTHIQALPLSDSEVKKKIPSLLRTYISAGSKICDTPALDKEFECIDFVTILDLENISSTYKRRYLDREVL